MNIYIRTSPPLPFLHHSILFTHSTQKHHSFEPASPKPLQSLDLIIDYLSTKLHPLVRRVLKFHLLYISSFRSIYRIIRPGVYIHHLFCQFFLIFETVQVDVLASLSWCCIPDLLHALCVILSLLVNIIAL